MFPFHLNLGFIVLHFYESFYYLISIIVGLFWGRKRIKRYLDLTRNYEKLIFWSLLFALLGTRLSHFIFWGFDLFWSDPSIVFKTWYGGASIVGGLMAGIYAAWIYCKIKKINFYEIFAPLAPVILLAQGLGRIGCFLNGDAHGIESNLPWAVRFPRYGIDFPSFKLNTSVSGYAWRWSYDNGLVGKSSIISVSVHPTQLYEMLGDFLLMFIILFIYKYLRQNNRHVRIILFIHTAGYALLRFSLEYIRADRAPVIFIGLSLLQMLFIVWIVFSFFYIVLNRNSIFSVKE